jgi:hypothetical protein
MLAMISPMESWLLFDWQEKQSADVKFFGTLDQVNAVNDVEHSRVRGSEWSAAC